MIPLREPVATVARRALLAVVVAALAASVALVLVPFTARGSAQHANAVVSFLGGCPQDEGEAVASGHSTAGAQSRCHDRGLLQLVGAGVALVVAGVAISAWSQIVVERESLRDEFGELRSPS